MAVPCVFTAACLPWVRCAARAPEPVQGSPGPFARSGVCWRHVAQCGGGGRSLTGPWSSARPGTPRSQSWQRGHVRERAPLRSQALVAPCCGSCSRSTWSPECRASRLFLSSLLFRAVSGLRPANLPALFGSLLSDAHARCVPLRRHLPREGPFQAGRRSRCCCRIASGRGRGAELRGRDSQRAAALRVRERRGAGVRSPGLGSGCAFKRGRRCLRHTRLSGRRRTVPRGLVHHAFSLSGVHVEILPEEEGVAWKGLWSHHQGPRLSLAGRTAPRLPCHHWVWPLGLGTRVSVTRGFLGSVALKC